MSAIGADLHDPEADAIYIRLRDLPYAFGEDLDRERRVDYGEDGKPIGIELLCVSQGVLLDDLPEAGKIELLLREQGVEVLKASRR